MNKITNFEGDNDHVDDEIESSNEKPNKIDQDLDDNDSD